MNADVFFLLDASGSVGNDSFQEVKDFVKDFVKMDLVKIGPNDIQVGVITFSEYATLRFTLNKYQEKKELLQAIDDLPYELGSTNTADAICMLMRDGFNETNGARPPSGTVFKVVVVVTDGVSNLYSMDCNNWTTVEAAKALHEANPFLLVYAIGVTGVVYDKELKAIASSDDHVKYLKNIISQETNEESTYELCEKGMYIANNYVTLLQLMHNEYV